MADHLQGIDGRISSGQPPVWKLNAQGGSSWQEGFLADSPDEVAAPELAPFSRRRAAEQYVGGVGLDQGSERASSAAGRAIMGG